MMIHKTIRVTDSTELSQVLDESERGPIVLDRHGEQYLLMRRPEESIWKGYDAERVIAAVQANAGSWADVDVDRLIADIYRWRQEGTRSEALE